MRAEAAPGCGILGAMQKCNQPLAQRTRTGRLVAGARTTGRSRECASPRLAARPPAMRCRPGPTDRTSGRSPKRKPARDGHRGRSDRPPRRPRPVESSRRGWPVVAAADAWSSSPASVAANSPKQPSGSGPRCDRPLDQWRPGCQRVVTDRARVPPFPNITPSACRGSIPRRGARHRALASSNVPRR